MVAASLRNLKKQKKKHPITQDDYTEVRTEHIYKDLWTYYFIALVYYL